MGRVMSCLKVGGVAKAVTSHYWKENYNTLAHHIAGNFVLEIYEQEDTTIRQLGAPEEVPQEPQPG